MAKDIIIQDEYYRANHMSGVTRLRTELEDGGVCYWIPEDEAVALTEKTITENGTYNAVVDDASGYSTVVVNVPNVFDEHDEGRVVKSGALVDQSSRTISANGTYDTTTNNSVIVETSSNLSTKTITVNGTYQVSTDNVDGYSDVTVSVPNTYSSSDEGKVVNNSALVSQSSRTISANGTYDTTTNNSVIVETSSSSSLSTKTITVNGSYQASSDNVDGYSDVTVSVPNTYTQSDEGKVVNNSALVSQSSRTIIVNGTYDTTTNNSVTVETTSNLSTKTITINGTYQASSDNVDGYSDVTVSVPNTYTQSDEGKVVYLQHYLVTQSSLLITKDGEYNTTYNDHVVVETGSYGPPNLIDYTVSENGTYSASEYGYDGFSEVTVDVQPNVTYSTFNENGTYSASEYGYDGFSEIEISVSSPVRFIIDRTIEYFEDNELETVGSYAFAGCTSLQTVSLPNCAYIYSSAFYGCDSLEYMYLLNPTSMTMLYEDPFSNSSIPTIYVPGGLAMDYKDDSYWGLYSDYIVAYEEENET